MMKQLKCYLMTAWDNLSSYDTMTLNIIETPQNVNCVIISNRIYLFRKSYIIQCHPVTTLMMDGLTFNIKFFNIFNGEEKRFSDEVFPGEFAALSGEGIG